jgi:hypothetical protein
VLVREVWQGEFIESDFLVDVYIGNLRQGSSEAASTRGLPSSGDDSPGQPGDGRTVVFQKGTVIGQG